MYKANIKPYIFIVESAWRVIMLSHVNIFLRISIFGIQIEWIISLYQEHIE